MPARLEVELLVVLHEIEILGVMDQSLVVILQLRVGMTRFLLFQRKSLDLFAADSSLGLFQKAFFADVLTDVCLTLLLHFLDIELR